MSALDRTSLTGRKIPETRNTTSTGPHLERLIDYVDDSSILDGHDEEQIDARKSQTDGPADSQKLRLIYTTLVYRWARSILLGVVLRVSKLLSSRFA